MLTEAVPAGYAKVGPSERPVLARKGPCLRLEYAHHVATRPLSGLSCRLHGILALLLGEEDGRDARRGAPEGYVGLSQLGRAGKDHQEDGQIRP